jgi:PKD repeat protein
MTLVAGDSEGTQVKTGGTVKVIDTSTDQNENLSSIKIKWGDGITITMGPGGTATHSYSKLGDKTVTLTATDLKGLKSTASTKIKVIK